MRTRRPPPRSSLGPSPYSDPCGDVSRPLLCPWPPFLIAGWTSLPGYFNSLLVPSPPASRVMEVCYQPPLHISIPTAVLVQTSAVLFKTPANHPHPSQSLSFMLQRERFFFKGLLRWLFISLKTNSSLLNMTYTTYTGVRSWHPLFYLLSFPGRHCPSSLPGKLILIFLVTSPLRSTSLPWLATVKCFLSV